MAESSIEQLKIYQLALKLEERVFQLAQQLPQDKFYPLGNNIRRASSAAAHYVAESHKRYSYVVKIESLHVARTYAEEILKLLDQFRQQGYPTDTLTDEYTILIKQSWGLIRYLKKRQDEKQSTTQVKANDELVAARS